MHAALLLLTGLAAAAPHASTIRTPMVSFVAPPEAPSPGRAWMGPGRHRHHRGGPYGYGGYGSYGGYGFTESADEAAGGFFEDGEAVPTRGGVRYLYDRSYPYEYYRPARARPAAWSEPRGEGCTTRVEGAVAVHTCRR
jgi:hypothetical protein